MPNALALSYGLARPLTSTSTAIIVRASDRIDRDSHRAGGQTMRSTTSSNHSRNPVARGLAMPVLGSLPSSSSFALVVLEGSYCEITGLNHCLVQLPAFSAATDTTDSQLDIVVKWWRPTSRTATAKWVVWFKDTHRGISTTQQYSTSVKRGTIAICPVLLTSQSITNGRLSDRWAKPTPQPARLLRGSVSSSSSSSSAASSEAA